MVKMGEKHPSRLGISGGSSARGLIAVTAVMLAVGLGAFAVQYYTWTAPARIPVTTISVTLSQENEMGAVHNGHETFSGVPAITIDPNVGENYIICFRIDNAAGSDLTTAFSDLNIKITLAGTENSAPLVINDVDQPPAILKFYGPDGLGFGPGTNVTPTIVITENTQAVTSAQSVTIAIGVYLEEA